MWFSEMVKQLQDAYKLTNIVIQSDCVIGDLSLFDQEQFSFDDEILYFAGSSWLAQAAVLPKCVIYYDKLPPKCGTRLVNSVQIEESAVSSIFQTLKSKLDSDLYVDKAYVHMLNMFISGSDLTTIVTELSKHTNELFAVIDSTGKILAHTKNFHVNYSVWMDSLERGYCTDVLMGYIEDRERRSGFPKTTVPCVLHCEFVDMYVLTSRIVANNELLGYVFVISKENVFHPLSQKVLPHILKTVRDRIINYEFRGAQYQNFLSNVLDGMSYKETKTKITSSKLKFPEKMRVALLRPLYYKYSSLQNLQQMLMKTFGSIPCTVNQNNLIAIFEVNNLSTVDQEKMKLMEQFAQDNHVQIYISNAFADIAELPAYFEQARITMSLSKRASAPKRVVFFSDYAYFALLDRISDDKILISCRHPILSLLAETDSEKGTELYKTLKIYTQTGFNKIKTAEILYLHRNTINYRIRQIESLWDIDLSDISLLFPLQFSFQIDEFLTNTFTSPTK